MRQRHLLCHLWAFALTLVAAPLMVHAQAQPAASSSAAETSSDSLEEVIITAERRSEDIQKTGLAISVVQGDVLEQQGNTDIQHVLQEVPSIVFQGLNASSIGGAGGPPLIDIRGIGTDGPNKTSATAVYEDGVLIEGGGADFFDINRVEILRGPQGTLYGRGATGGAVNIITNDPTQTFGGSGQLTIGSYDLVGTQGALNLPLADTLAARLSFNTIHHVGFFDQGESGDGESDVRLKLLFKPNDSFSLMLGGIYYSADQTDPGVVVISAAQPNPTQGWTTPEVPGGRDQVTFEEGYAHAELDLGFGVLTYIPAYQATHSSNYSAAPFYSTNVMPYNNTLTQELRLASPATSTITWLGGLYYFNQHFFQCYCGQPPAFPPGFYVDQDYANSSAAAFGEVTYPLTSSLRITGGVRESRDTVYHTDAFSFQPGDRFKQDYDHFDYKARLEDDLTDRNLLYGMISTGYRPGGGVNGQGYPTEAVTAYEIGSKNRVGEILTVNAALFYDDYNHFDSPQSTLPPDVVTSVLGASATIYGAELEAVGLITPEDRFSVAATYLHARFTENINYDDSQAGITTLEPLDGQYIPHAPTWMLNGSYSHTFKFPNGATLVPSFDAHYQTWEFTDFDVSDYDSPPNAEFVQRAYVITNASITYAPNNGRYRVTAYAHNLNDVIYKTSFDRAPGTDYAYVNDPRTFGVIVSANF